jgi:lipopolysaccharide/colanic/teichoic acid biosynthesis glycosyltransferase
VAFQDNKSIQANSAAAACADVHARRPAQLAKRILDIVAAIVGLVLFSPILLIASIAIKLDSRGPILVRQTAYGYRNRMIEVRQFRTVRADVKHINPPSTRVGQILRKTGIDELPELLNVLSGDMSMIGPRPRIHPSALLNKSKPGMTDWAQIVGFQD